ncbi:hypothetical protein [Variovorax sp. 770b2]|jgi:hypothetical protein|nr:hypothetical protein [Variovorax sp. 770b2]SFQ31420.1 hypothetical protein SAMN03159339_6683 [Variovorax sp. 770b2]
MSISPTLRSTRAFFLDKRNVVALLAMLASLGSWLVFWFGE